MLVPASDPPKTRRAAEICRGTLRLLGEHGFFGATEVTLANNRRADIAALGPAGDIWIIEVKSSVADFRSDEKWADYLPFCNRFSFAVAEDFPRELIPSDVGLIVADSFHGAIIRDAPERALAAARRKAVTLRLARLAGARLTGLLDPGWATSGADLAAPLS